MASANNSDTSSIPVISKAEAAAYRQSSPSDLRKRTAKTANRRGLFDTAILEETCHGTCLRLREWPSLGLPIWASLSILEPGILRVCIAAPKKDHGHCLCPNRGPIACHKHEKLRTRSASRLMGIASCSAETMLAMSLLATTASLFGSQ
jgi:hypothetical protein